MFRTYSTVLSVLLLTSNLSAQEKPKEKFHIFLLMGQSNMTGFGKMLPEDRKPVPRVVMAPYAVRTKKKMKKNFKWEPAAHPLHAGTPSNRFGMGLPFAIEYLKTQPDDVVVGLIPAAAGGAGIDQLKKGRYPDAIEKARFAMKQGVVKGVLWHQGESDTVSEARADAYEQKLHKYIADLRKDLGDDKLPFIVGNLAEFYGTGRGHSKPERVKRINQVRDVLRSLPRKVKYTGFVESTGCSSPDKHLVHFDRKSYIILGKRYANAYTETVKQAGKSGKKSLTSKGSTRDEPFQKEQWPQARTLVWANPGKSGSMQSPRNWTEYASTADYLAEKEGRPAGSPPDKKTDIILPDSPDGQSYVVACIERRKGDSDSPRRDCRHITIGKGAGLDGACEFNRGRPVYPGDPGLDTPMGIYGNVTVNDGGYIYGPHVFLGDKQTYFRVGKSPEPLGRSWTIGKSNDASVTLLSRRYDLAGGVTVRSGRMVLGSGSRLCFGAGLQGRIELKKDKETGMLRKEGYVHVHKTGALEMHSGSRIGRIRQPKAIVADLRIEGLLQIGRPGEKCDRPAVIELGMTGGDGGFLAQHGGLYIRSSARVRNFGRLAITSCHRDSPARSDKGISLFLEKAVDLGDVSFDYLRAGGIVATDDKTAQAVAAGASFGKHCAAKGDKLLSTLAVMKGLLYIGISLLNGTPAMAPPTISMATSG